MDHDPSTTAVIDQFNRAFVEHRADLLDDLIAADCVMESVNPAPDGERYEGAAACLTHVVVRATTPAAVGCAGGTVAGRPAGAPGPTKERRSV